MKKWLLLLACILVFLGLYSKAPLPLGQPGLGHVSIPDTDGDLLISLSIARGERLYESFSIVYPPGRFLLQAAALRLSGFSFPIIGTMHIAANILIFPAMMFLLAFWLFRALFRLDIPKGKSPLWDALSLLFALGAGAVYLGLIHSAQEVHTLLVLFFVVLLVPGTMTKLRVALAGLLLGLVFLFRVDSGIFLTGALFVSWLSQSQAVKSMLLERWRYGVLGLSSVWVPTLLLLILHGSLRNFLYDTLVLGLLIQPRFMSLPFPLNSVWLIFLSSLIFVTSAALALFLEPLRKAKKNSSADMPQTLGIQTFAVVSVLSFVAALGRSDEPHLWYGLIWWPPLLFYALYRVAVTAMRNWPPRLWSVSPLARELAKTLVVGLLAFGFGRLMMEIKSPPVFLLTATVLFATVRFWRVKPVALLLGGSLAALAVFHSVSYLKLRWHFPTPPLQRVFSPDWLTAQPNEVHGLLIFPETQRQLQPIQALIPKQEEYLFIFPKNLLLLGYFGKRNPTRHIIMMNERTDYTEQEILDQLLATNTRYFLVFPEDAETRGGAVWEWILSHTRTIKSFMIDDDIVELRKRTIEQDRAR